MRQFLSEENLMGRLVDVLSQCSIAIEIDGNKSVLCLSHNSFLFTLCVCECFYFVTCISIQILFVRRNGKKTFKMIKTYLDFFYVWVFCILFFLMQMGYRRIIRRGILRQKFTSRLRCFSRKIFCIGSFYSHRIFRRRILRRNIHRVRFALEGSKLELSSPKNYSFGTFFVWDYFALAYLSLTEILHESILRSKHSLSEIFRSKYSSLDHCWHKIILCWRSIRKKDFLYGSEE
jgi:hypothetical protein